MPVGMAEYDTNLVPAKNAPGSVSVSNLRVDFEINPINENFWKLIVDTFIRDRCIQGKRGISILDGGCGTGAYAYTMVDESLLQGLTVSIVLADLIPSNLDIATKGLKRLKELRPNQVHIQRHLGDLLQRFPEQNFDLVCYLELVHWLEPSQVSHLFDVTSKHMNKFGLMVVSYATSLNNASLRDRRGNLDLRRRGFGRTITKVSEATGTKMTFYERNDIIKMGELAGFKPYAFEQLDNPYFPTRTELHYPFFRGATSTENEIIAFRKL